MEDVIFFVVSSELYPPSPPRQPEWRMWVVLRESMGFCLWVVSLALRTSGLFLLQEEYARNCYKMAIEANGPYLFFPVCACMYVMHVPTTTSRCV